MADWFREKNISIDDNIYGYIDFDMYKFKDILDNPYFKRLHHIKQMGFT